MRKFHSVVGAVRECGILPAILLGVVLISGCGLLGSSASQQSEPTGSLSSTQEELAQAEPISAKPSGDGASGKADFDENSSSPEGIDWIFIELPGLGAPVPTVRPLSGFILAKEGGRMVGSTACNTMTSAYSLDVVSGALRFRILRNGQALCARNLADTENAVLNAMVATDAYTMKDGTLELLSKGVSVATLRDKETMRR